MGWLPERLGGLAARLRTRAPDDPVLRAAVVGAVLLAMVLTYPVVGLVRDQTDGPAVNPAAGGGQTPPAGAPRPGEECRAVTAAGERTLSGAQAKAVTTVAAVARQRGTPTVAVAWVLDTVLSQDRPPALTAARAAALLTRPGRGTPSPSGLALAQALDGTRPAALSCAYWRRSGLPEQPLERSGLTARATALKEGYERVFGELPDGGYRRGGVKSGHVDNSAHYDGRAIDVFFRPQSAENRRDGWVFAHWLVAHGDSYDLLSVIFDDRIWTVWASFAGWRPYVHPSGNTTNPVLRHLEHVHTAVVRGGRPGTVLGR
jgi:hypothetical protein